MSLCFLYLRLVEEVKDKTGIVLTNEDVYMATTLDEFTKAVVLISRGGGAKKEFTYNAVLMLYLSPST